MSNINNTVIKVLNQEHGKKVVKWFVSQGVNVPENYLRSDLPFSTECNDDYYIYYGLSGNLFENWSQNYVNEQGLNVIELPETINEPILNILL